MSTFENPDYKWRETYFVLFESARRPTLEQMKRTLKALNPRFELVNPEANDDARFESITIHSPQDYAAMDICYEVGDEVKEQAAELQREMKGMVDASERSKLAQLAKFDAKFDVLHFEQRSGVPTAGDEEEEGGEGDMLDPSALLLVMEALVELTRGVSVDPQSGSLM